MSIAAWFMALGAWMVFPFAGLEVAIVSGVLLWLGRRSEEWERLEVADDSVRVSCWRGGIARSWCFQRHWMSVALEPPRHRGHARRLLIGTHGRALEVGRMLGDEEREQLCEALGRAVSGVADPATANSRDFKNVPT